MDQIRINSREARAQWRDLLDFIQNDQHEVIIERYGKPIGKLIPYKEQKQAPLIKEATTLYQLQGFQQMNDQSHANRRAQLHQQLDTLPDGLVELLTQFLAQLTPTAGVSPAAPQPQPAQMASQWVGLLSNGYEGDALADSESLYE